MADAAASAPVIASDVYAMEAGEAAQAARVAELSAIVDQLRADSTSGWQALQSDSTGYAAEVSGGRLSVEGSPEQAVAVFMERYGALFGTASGLVYGLNGYADTGFATVWVEQAIDGVPVDGAQVIASVRTRGGVSEVQSVAGTLVDVSGVDVAPVLSANQAVATVSQALGVSANPDPVLVVTTQEGVGLLAWAVTVEAGPSVSDDSVVASLVEYPALVLVDATDGTILSHRVAATSPQGKVRAATVGAVSAAGSSSAIDYGNYGFSIPRGGRPIVIETTYLRTIPIRVNAQKLPDGSIILVDATGEGASTATKKGVIVGLDGSDVSSEETQGDLVAGATLVRYPNAASIPQDALYAMWGARETLDYLNQELGMLSFDGRNSPVPIVYNYTDGDSCYDNASFTTAPGVSFMAVGVPCADENGSSIPTVADIDTIAHELGHGVIHSHTFARSTIQQGALDEGTADYLGMILRNGIYGEASPLASADICKKIGGEHSWCLKWKDGVGLRSLNTGATFSDYAFTIEDVVPNTVVTQLADSGHTNSMVWTNALWQARKAIASLDGGDMTDSETVRAFDRAVILASTRWTPGTEFGAAAEGVVRAATEAGLPGQALNLIRDRFRANGVCGVCKALISTGSTISPVSVSTDTKSRPVALGPEVGYLRLTPDGMAGGFVATPGSLEQRPVGPPAWITLHINGHGSTVLQSQVDLSSDGTEELPSLGRANVSTGAYDVVSENLNPVVAPAASGSANVWVDLEGTIHYRPVSGGKTKKLASDGVVAHVATSGDRVAFLMDDGRLRLWTVSTNAVRDLAVYDPAPFESFVPEMFLLPVGSLDMAGDRVAVVGSTVYAAPIHVFDLAANTKTTMSKQALPLGVAVNGRHVVWVESKGDQVSPIFGEDGLAGSLLDTELQGYGFAKATKYRMVDNRGQQAFPSLSDDGLLAWQESANGNSDIYAMRLKSD